MNRDEHVAIADSEGYFYCRAVDGRLNYRKEQQVCGRGCPCYTEGTLCVPGQFVCCYGIGTVWFITAYTQANGPISVLTALGYCVFPFIVPDLLKLALALVISRRVSGYLK